jgi:hypothetical protein
LIKILYEKVREPKVKKQYSPENLKILLEEVETEEDFDNN